MPNARSLWASLKEAPWLLRLVERHLASNAHAYNELITTVGDVSASPDM